MNQSYHQYINLSNWGKLQGINPFDSYMTLGLTQPHPHCYPPFTTIIINTLASLIGKIDRGYPFLFNSDPWSDTPTSSVISIIYKNNHQCIKLSHKKIERYYPF